MQFTTTQPPLISNEYRLCFSVTFQTLLLYNLEGGTQRFKYTLVLPSFYGCLGKKNSEFFYGLFTKEWAGIYNVSGYKQLNPTSVKVPVLQDISSFPFKFIKHQKHRVPTRKDAETTQQLEGSAAYTLTVCLTSIYHVSNRVCIGENHLFSISSSWMQFVFWNSSRATYFLSFVCQN